MPWGRLLLIGSLLVVAVACASGGGGEAEPVPFDPDRRFRVQVRFADRAETLNLVEGETVTLERDDATYTLTPSVQGAPAGKAVVLVVRDTPAQQVQARLLLGEGAAMELSQTLGEPWPELTVELDRVRPRLVDPDDPTARDAKLGSGFPGSG